MASEVAAKRKAGWRKRKGGEIRTAGGLLLSHFKRTMSGFHLCLCSTTRIKKGITLAELAWWEGTQMRQTCVSNMFTLVQTCSSRVLCLLQLMLVASRVSEGWSHVVSEWYRQHFLPSNYSTCGLWKCFLQQQTQETQIARRSQ
jgi:hypothetical protein